MRTYMSFFSIFEIKHLKISNETLSTSGFTLLAINKFSVTYFPGMEREQAAG